ncbi:hypothetical protein M430DRAFT_22761 [Amorphotheca resinae ATCC 22711]|uniref:Uncharacterized protein n=1 Tax=Amorphotheca resinae ATCC 22711 TaxID=857342 RepID=A0A2T3AQI3_AMORE|nr:hypothetical protein M430DRAFT_22761 [Amorphotheca resinae ATCC 22711]PSS08523.1 hypothetical protein M430DRAFT_22761 [Amorphotheca resinae ATCC 22711]
MPLRKNKAAAKSTLDSWQKLGDESIVEGRKTKMQRVKDAAQVKHQVEDNSGEYASGSKSEKASSDSDN